ncbi:MAG TPA: patatin-like phospholipase family protein [Dongiaceae bacterium]|nr:patatin-like phospholipase family protein [Dongiaceae bacterium]
MKLTTPKAPSVKDKAKKEPSKPMGQIVLVLQGGGALGAYQAGVYQGLSEAGIEPDWVIGTSIGAINAALIAGNKPGKRVAAMREFWERMRSLAYFGDAWLGALSGVVANFGTVARGVPGFFAPNPLALFGLHFPAGAGQAAYYTTAPLKETLNSVVDFDCLNSKQVRLTVGAVNAMSGMMRYFDSRDMKLDAAHVMASGALPPAFPAVEIEGEPYWDGGIYSNTPIEVVFDDKPRRDSVIFSVNMWQPSGPAPDTLWQVMGRQKDIQYSSRGLSHVARQQQLHRLRHVIRELAKRLPPDVADDPEVRELAAYGCGTNMHLVRLLAPRLDNEDHTKDIDFTQAGISARWQAGYEYVQQVIAARPWESPIDPLSGIVIHQAEM